MKSRNADSPIPEILLADIDRLAGDLSRRVQASGFRPDLIAYIETGARLPAVSLCRALEVPALAVWAQRPGAGWKARLAPLACRFPRWLKNMLRFCEMRSRIHGGTARTVTLPTAAVLHGKRVLLFDDAVDTGRTLAAVRAALVARGVSEQALRTAALAATTPEACRMVNYYLFAQNCRMPWSADSAERSAALASMQTQIPPGL